MSVSLSSIVFKRHLLRKHVIIITAVSSFESLYYTSVVRPINNYNQKKGLWQLKVACLVLFV